MTDKNLIELSETEIAIRNLIFDANTNDRNIDWAIANERNIELLLQFHRKNSVYFSSYEKMLTLLKNEGQCMSMPTVETLMQMTKYDNIDQNLYFKYIVNNPERLLAYQIYKYVHH